MTSTQVFN